MRKSILAGYILVSIPMLQVARADFILGDPVNLGATMNSSQEDAGPSISADGLSLYFNSKRPDGSNCDIWVSTRVTTEDDWTAPVNLGPPVNASAAEAFPSISSDGLELYFCDGPAGFRPGGFGSTDLWVTRRTSVSQDWGIPENLGPIVNTTSTEAMPSISADGLELYLSFELSGAGSGNWEIYVTKRPTTDADWGTPVNLGLPVSTSAMEGWPSMSADGLILFFASNWSGGSGGVDLWMARRQAKDAPWEEPVNLGPTINSSAWDVTPHLSPDGSVLYFASDRAGGHGNFDLWQVSITPVLDFDNDGTVNLGDFAWLALNWNQNEPFVDIAPPMGDGKVDFRDLAALADRYWLWQATDRAWDPSPKDGAQGVAPNTTLRWKTGDLLETEGYAVDYIVYFDAAPATLPELDTVEMTSCDLAGLEPSTTYYWRVDTRRKLNRPPFTTIITPGQIWSFTTMAGPSR